MTTTHHHDEELLPMPQEDLEALADYYDTHDTGDDAETDANVRVVDPSPMVSTSLRLPEQVRDALKERARREGVRYTTLLRRILEDAVDPDDDEATSDDRVDDLADRVSTLEHYLAAATGNRTRRPFTWSITARSPPGSAHWGPRKVNVGFGAKTVRITAATFTAPTTPDSPEEITDPDSSERDARP